MDDAELTSGELKALADRARAWRARGDPTTLWPALEPDALQPAADEIGRVVCAVLQSRPAALGNADSEDAYALGIAALLTGTGPLLGSWIERGSVTTSPAVALVLAQHLAHGRQRMDRMRQGALAAITAMREHGVTPAVIKGFHTAHVYFDEPGTRPLADVDVLVHPEERLRAETALRAAGFTPHPSDRPDRKRDWCPPGEDGQPRSFELWHARSSWKLELHTQLAFGHLMEFGVQLSEPAAFDGRLDVLGVPFRVARPALLVAVLATHASGELYAMRLLRLIELVLVVRHERAAGALDWDEVEAVLTTSGAFRFAYPALALTEQLAPGTIDPPLLERARRVSAPRALAVMRDFTPTSPVLERATSLSERLMWAGSRRQTLHRMIRMVIPPPSESFGALLEVYHVRLRRLLTGAVSWRAAPGKSPDDRRR
jgi:hypothetical protein